MFSRVAREPVSMTTCVVCGETVETSDDGSAGIVIEYNNLTPEYTERYGFCRDHRPSDKEIEEVKRRIKQGHDPASPSEDEVEAFREAMQLDTEGVYQGDDE